MFVVCTNAGMQNHRNSFFPKHQHAFVRVRILVYIPQSSFRQVWLCKLNKNQTEFGNSDQSYWYLHPDSQTYINLKRCKQVNAQKIVHLCGITTYLSHGKSGRGDFFFCVCVCAVVYLPQICPGDSNDLSISSLQCHSLALSISPINILPL